MLATDTSKVMIEAAKAIALALQVRAKIKQSNPPNIGIRMSNSEKVMYVPNM